MEDHHTMYVLLFLIHKKKSTWVIIRGSMLSVPHVEIYNTGEILSRYQNLSKDNVNTYFGIH